MAAPEKNNVTEIDLFSALGLTGDSGGNTVRLEAGDAPAGADGEAAEADESAKAEAEAARKAERAKAAASASASAKAATAAAAKAAAEKAKAKSGDSAKTSSKSPSDSASVTLDIDSILFAGDVKPAKKAAPKPGEISDDMLLDIFTPSDSSFDSEEAERAQREAEVAKEREAQLKEAAIRSRQWKEDFERQKRDEWMTSDAPKRSFGPKEAIAEVMAEAESETEVETEVEAEQTEAAVEKPTSTVGRATFETHTVEEVEEARKEAASESATTVEEFESKSSDIITVEANPVLLEEKVVREKRETTWGVSEPAPRPGRYGRDGGVSSGASTVGAREARDILDGRQPSRDQSSQDAARAAAGAAAAEAAGAAAFQPRSGRSSQQPMPGAGPMPDMYGMPQQSARDGRASYPPPGWQRSDRPYPGPQNAQMYAGAQAADPSRMRPPMPQPRPDMPDARATQQPPRAEQPPAPAPSKGRTKKDDPLGIILIVLAVLCVLVAASLLTGLWDISNL